MRVFRWLPTPQGGRVWITAWLAAVAIVLATVVPVLAVKTPLRLVEAAVAPRTVTEGETLTVRVTYRNLDGVAAASVRFEFDGKSYALSRVKSKKNVRAGFRYEPKVTPPAGSGSVPLVATDLRGRSLSLAAGRLVVEALPPPPDPGGTDPGTGPGGADPGTDPGGTDPGGTDPGSTDPGTDPGRTDPGGAGSSGSGSSGSGSSGSGSSGSGSSGSASGSTGSGSTGTAAGGAPGTPGSGTGPILAGLSPTGGSSDSTGESSPLDPDRTPGGPTTVADEPVTAAVDPDGSGRSGSRHTPPAAALGAAGLIALGPSTDPLAAVLPVLVTTLGGATMLMAFMVFGKRRRDGEPTDSDLALATAAATGSGAVASAALVDGLPDSSRAPAPIPVDAEMAMPRWRRPSLLEARKADPLRMAAAPAVSLTFDHGLVEPVAGHERRSIRYRVVRLLDRPDELTALDVGVLDAGDEVQLLERSGVYWFVLSPDGQQGWVHKMVLGEVIEEPEDLPGPAARAIGLRESGEEALAARLATVDAPSPTGWPGGSDIGGDDPAMQPVAWTMRGAPATDAGADVDDDVMRAFMAAQGRS